MRQGWAKHFSTWVYQFVFSKIVLRVSEVSDNTTGVLLIKLYTPCISSTKAAAVAKSLQSCPTVCDPIDCSPPGFPIPGILQARTLEWVAISFSNAWKWNLKVKSLSRVWLFVTPWTTAHKAPPSMGFSRQEYWSGVPLHSLLIFHSEMKFVIFIETFHLINTSTSRNLEHDIGHWFVYFS